MEENHPNTNNVPAEDIDGQSDVPIINQGINIVIPDNNEPSDILANHESKEQLPDLSHNQRIRKYLSIIGLIVSVGFIAQTINLVIQMKTCTGEFCGLFVFMELLMVAGIGIFVLLISLAGLATSSRSYLNKNSGKKSKFVFFAGILIILAATLVLLYSLDLCASEFSVGINFLYFTGPLLIAGFVGLFMGLSIISKALRIKNRLKFISIALLCTVSLLTIFSIFDYNYAKYENTKQQKDWIMKQDATEKARQNNASAVADFEHTQASTIKDDPSGQFKIYTNTFLGISITYPSNWELKKNTNGSDSSILIAINSPITAEKEKQYDYFENPDFVLSYENIKNSVEKNSKFPIYVWRKQSGGKNVSYDISQQYLENINSIDFTEYDNSLFHSFSAVFTKGDNVIGLAFNNSPNKTALENNNNLYNILHSVTISN